MSRATHPTGAPVNDITDAEVHQAAANLHYRLTTLPAPEDADGFLAHSTAWPEISLDLARRDEARERVRNLVMGAADVSQWAVELGATGLKPHRSHAWGGAEGFDLAVHVAASDRLSLAHRREFVRAMHAAVEDTYRRFLGQVPAGTGSQAR